MKALKIKKVELTGPKCCRDSKHPTEYPFSFFLWLQKPSVYCWGWQCAQSRKRTFHFLLWMRMADETCEDVVGWSFGGNSFKGDNLPQRNILFPVLCFFLLAWDKDVVAGVFRGFWAHEVSLRMEISSTVWRRRLIEVWALSYRGATSIRWDCLYRLTPLRENNHHFIYPTILPSCSTQPSLLPKVTQLGCSKPRIWNEVFLSWKVISLTTQLFVHSEHGTPCHCARYWRR